MQKTKLKYPKNGPASEFLVEEMAMGYEFTAQDLADVLDITPKTLSRWKGRSNVFSIQQADRMLIVKSILDLGKKVLGSEERVKDWIHQPVFALDGHLPIELFKTESGRRRVENTLHQIQLGIL